MLVLEFLGHLFMHRSFGFFTPTVGVPLTLEVVWRRFRVVSIVVSYLLRGFQRHSFVSRHLCFMVFHLL